MVVVGLVLGRRAAGADATAFFLCLLSLLFGPASLRREFNWPEETPSVGDNLTPIVSIKPISPTEHHHCTHHPRRGFAHVAVEYIQCPIPVQARRKLGAVSGAFVWVLVQVLSGGHVEGDGKDLMEKQVRMKETAVRNARGKSIAPTINPAGWCPVIG